MADDKGEKLLEKKFQTPEEIIKGYKMEEGEYKVIVKILEANDLIPTFSGFIFKSKGSSCDAFIEVEIGSQKRATKVKKGELSPLFN